MLFNSLSEIDKEKISLYINTYAGLGNCNYNDRASLPYLLREWNAEKQEMFSLLGKQLIISKKVEFTKELDELVSDFNILYQTNSAFCRFRDNMVDLFLRSYNTGLRTVGYALMDHLFDTTVLAKNKVNYSFIIPVPNGQDILVQEGSKPVKMLGKIAKAYGIEGFEEFRLGHSQIHNQKKTSGELCLSIHPLDFMTMSDNGNNWTSCMSWNNEGGYRRGTVEMMNSCCVVVAYLKSNKDFNLYTGCCKDDYCNDELSIWNSKKWRSLFVVTPEVIANVKGYPYENSSLVQEILKWLGELANKNLNWNFDIDNIYPYKYRTSFELKNQHTLSLHFSTYDMYNDFGSTDHQCIVSDKILSSNEDVCTFINYSGEASCMCCGEVTAFAAENEHLLICESCDTTPICHSCQGHIHEEDFYIVNEKYYCSCCYDEEFTECPVTGKLVETEKTDQIYLSRSNETEFIEGYNQPTYTEFNILVDESVWVVHPEDWKEFFTAPPTKITGEYDIKYYYIHPNECTPAGLELFSIHSEKQLNSYILNEESIEDFIW